jgi:hypothetical protein
MPQTAARYDRWKAPAEDGQILLWPEPDALLSDTCATQERLGSAGSTRLQNVPLNEVRRAMRKWVGHDDALPLIATGHQAELHHAGVWAKNILISAAAAKLGGRAVHFAVDTDEPKHLLLRWPGGSVPLTDDPALGRAAWSGMVAPPTPAHLDYVSDTFSSAASKWRFVPMVGDVLSSLRQFSAKSANLSSALTESLQQFDSSLGLRYDAMLVSPITFSEPYLLLAHHILARADAFVADYNAALEDYRRQNRIKNPGRPMPNLRLSGDACEVPFWLDSLASGTRSRATVFRSAGAWVLKSDQDEEFRFDPSADGWHSAQRLMDWLRQQSLRLSPRALTLTAVLRLLLADNFVHGIGGAQYDQVLDALIERQFGIEPPRFAVTTATLYFPDAVGEPKVCLPCLVQEGHRLKHSILGSDKMRLVHEIEAAPRRSLQRASLFAELHERLAVAWTSIEVRNWERHLREAEQRAIEERVLFDRELFYAIQPRHRLDGLIDAYRERLT